MHNDVIIECTTLLALMDKYAARPCSRRDDCAKKKDAKSENKSERLNSQMKTIEIGLVQMIGNARALRKSKPLASSSKRASVQSNFRIIKTTLDGELVVKFVCPGNEFGQVRIWSFSPILIWPETTTLTLFRVDPDSKEPLGFQFHLEESPSSLASIEMRDERDSTSALYAQGRSGSIFIILILDGQGSTETWPRTMFNLLCFVLFFVGAVSAGGTLEKLHEGKQSLIPLGSGASRKAIEFSSSLLLYRCDLRLRLVAVHDFVEDERKIADALRKCSNETSRDNGVSNDLVMQPLRAPVVLGDWKSLLSLSQIALLDCLVTSSYSGHLGVERDRRALLSRLRVATGPRPIISINGAQSKSGTLYPRPPLIAGDMPFSVPLFVLKPRNHETFWLVATSSNSFRLSRRKITSPPPSTPPPSPPSPYAWRRRLPKYPLESYWKSLNRIDKLEESCTYQRTKSS
ncbi:semaphorin-2A isoform X3 [Vespula squamosa]|uniref:Semaphorin-2A isoform X3 n=1 Tax=Vespula squamosa TaxID=30214 RepID=A0ABD1ZXR3_VESSQ